MKKISLASYLISLFFVQTALAATIQCPETVTSETLTAFRESAISSALNGNYSDVNSSIRNCFPEVPKCLDPVQKYVNAKSDGYAQYERNLTPVEGVTVSSVDQLPPELVTPQKTIKLPKDIMSLAKKKGWKAISYKTRSTGGFDNGPNLVLIAIPGPDKDIYLQISPPSENDYHRSVNEPYGKNVDPSKGQNTLTMITVNKQTNPPVGQLHLMEKDINDSYRYSNQIRAAGDDCISCHASPLRSISPRGYQVTHGGEKRMKPEDEKMVDEINEMMVVPGLTWGTFQKDGKKMNIGPADDSHPLGWAPPDSRTRKEDFLKTCATSETSFNYRSITRDYTVNLNYDRSQALDYQKVASAMSCNQCHSNSVRGSLHEHFSPAEIQFKIMVDKSMPPGFELNGNERMALYNCIMAERSVLRDDYKKSAEWMKKSDCEVSNRRRRTNRDTTAPAGGTSAPAEGTR